MAAAALILLFGVGLASSDSYTEFRKHSNGNPEYVLGYAKGCESGLRDSGFAFAPTGSIMLKQVNKDGSVGEICTE